MGFDHRHGRRRSLRRCLAAASASGAFLLASAGAALADTAAISVTDTAGASDPAAEVPRTFTISGNVTAPKRYFVKYRPTGGTPCATSADADSGKSFPGWYGPSANGNFSNAQATTWDVPGSYLFCIWLATSSTQVVTPISQEIAFRSPTGTIAAAINPITPRPGQQATVTVSGQSEAPKRVFARVRREGAPCAPTWDADTGTSVVGGTTVNGSFSVQGNTTQSAAGNYVICLWLASSSTDTSPVAGPQPVPFSVVAPACVVPSLSRRTTLAAAKRRLSRANCRLGRVTRKYSSSVRRGRVIKSSPRAGARLAGGARVRLVVSRGRRR